MKLRAVPHEVEAIKFEGQQSFLEMLDTFGGNFRAKFEPELGVMYLRSGHKMLTAYPGTWVIRTNLGVFYLQDDKLVRENFDIIK